MESLSRGSLRRNPVRGLVNRNLSDPAISAMCRLLADCVLVHGPGSAVAALLLEAVWYRIQETDDSSEVASTSRGSLLRWQEELAKAMLADANNATSIADIAYACGMSVSQFSRRFKNGVGIGPQRWRMVQKISRAQALLLLPHYSMTQAAGECGFAEPSQFSHTFRKIVGESPSVWRRQNTLSPEASALSLP